MLEHTGTFEAVGSDGETYTVLEYTDYIDRHTAELVHMFSSACLNAIAERRAGLLIFERRPDGVCELPQDED